MRLRATPSRAMPAAATVAFLAILTFGCSPQVAESDSIPSPTPSATQPTEPPVHGLETIEPTATSDRDPHTNSYLEATVQPCTPIAGSKLDPCERRFDEWERITSPYIGNTPPQMVSPPNIEGAISDLLYRDIAIPHVVLRGTFVADTTRCAEQSHAFYGGSRYGFHEVAKIQPYLHDRCFGDVRVNEYLIGRGPSHLTVDLGSHHKILDLTGEEYYDWLLEIHSIFEEREFIIWLLLPVSYNFSAWKMLSYPWDVQKKPDGTVVVVDWLARDLSHLPRDENGFESDLNEFRETLNQVYASYTRSTGGKTTNAEGAPDLIHDANTEFIRSHMMRSEVFTILDATPAAPPPIPGEDDLYTPGQNILDATATATVEVPGGLTDLDTPTPILEDEPTAIATVESTATPEPMPTVTPEPVPTPETTLEPTATATPEPVPTPDPADTPTPESDLPLGPGDATATPEDPLAPGTSGEDSTETPEPDQPRGPGA